MVMMLHADKQHSAPSSFKTDMTVVIAILSTAVSSECSELVRMIE
jgi:hypothetical protein